MDNDGVITIEKYENDKLVSVTVDGVPTDIILNNVKYIIYFIYIN